MTSQSITPRRTPSNFTFSEVPLGAGASLDLAELTRHADEWLRPAYVSTVSTNIAYTRGNLLNRLERPDFPLRTWEEFAKSGAFETTLIRNSATERYSLALLFHALDPDHWRSLFAEALYSSTKAVPVLSFDFGSIRTSLNRWDHTTDSWTVLSFRVNDPIAWNKTAIMLRQASQVSSAGRYLGGEIRTLQLTTKDLESLTPIHLGSAAFLGPLSGLAAEALLDRFVPGVTNLTPTLSGELDNIAQRVDRSLFKVEQTQTGYQIRADAFIFDISQDAKLEKTIVSITAMPYYLIRSASRWFSATHAASELSAVLLATGIGDVIQSFTSYVLEHRDVDELGNGYACVSRRVLEMLADRNDPDTISLCRLNELYNNELPEVLALYERLPSLSDTTIYICRLLRQILTKPQTPDTFPLNTKRQRFMSCEQSETLFIKSLQTGRYHLDDYFIHKYTGETSHGERTSLTRKPIQVGGAILPTGTLCAVHYPSPPEPQTPTVLPLRLSMFAFPFEIGREVFGYHFRVIGQELRGENEKNVLAVYELLS
jgi:hypothetical protein